MSLLPLLWVLLPAAVVAAALWWRTRPRVSVYPPQVGLLYRDGRFVRRLEPGRHPLSPFGAAERAVLVTLGDQPVVLPEATLLSRDRFSFRLGATVLVRVEEPQVFAEAAGLGGAYAGHVHEAGAGYAALQPAALAALQALAAARTLDELLDDRAGLAASLAEALAGVVPGAAVTGVLVTALTLPPETRRMFTDAERARREGLAALERARAEQASLRALANAARLLRDHPGLADLRLFQAIEARRGATTLVLGRDAAGQADAGQAGAPD